MQFPRLFFVVVSASAALFAVGHVAACGASDTDDLAAIDPGDAGAYDATPVAPLDGGPRSDGAAGTGPTCEDYCKDVLQTCTGDDAQYGSPEECMRICARLAPGELGDKDVDTTACRAYHASTNAKTDATTWCAAAGPFGGGVCGDRCGAFCKLASSVCSDAETDAGAPWPSEPDCVTACAGFAYLDGGTDGGGEGAGGEPTGNTLNCRLRVLREAVEDRARCVDLGPESETCR